jgi:hypothetical protein
LSLLLLQIRKLWNSSSIKSVFFFILLDVFAAFVIRKFLLLLFKFYFRKDVAECNWKIWKSWRCDRISLKNSSLFHYNLRPTDSLAFTESALIPLEPRRAIKNVFFSMNICQKCRPQMRKFIWNSFNELVLCHLLAIRNFTIEIPEIHNILYDQWYDMIFGIRKKPVLKFYCFFANFLTHFHNHTFLFIFTNFMLALTIKCLNKIWVKKTLQSNLHNTAENYSSNFQHRAGSREIFTRKPIKFRFTFHAIS